MGGAPIEGIVLLGIAGRRIPWQMVDIRVALVSTIPALQFVVSHAGVKGHVAHALPIEIKVGADVLIPRAIGARTNAAAVDDVAGVEDQIKMMLRHLGCYI